MIFSASLLIWLLAAAILAESKSFIKNEPTNTHNPNGVNSADESNDLETSESHGLMKAGLALHLLKKHHHRHDDDGRSAINTDNYGDEYRSDLLGYPNPDTFDFDNNDELEDYSLLPAHIDQMRRNNFERNMYEGHLVQNRPNLISAGMPVVVGNPIMAQMRMNRMNPMYSMNSMYSMKPMHPMYPMNPMNPMNMNYWG